MKLSYQIATFSIIGITGFLVDSAVLTFLSIIMEVDIYISRLISFALASIVTWILNRNYTFRQKNGLSTKKLKYLPYVIIQINGALINLSIFAYVVSVYPVLREKPIIPLAVGSVVALFFNFFGVRMWVYQK